MSPKRIFDASISFLLICLLLPVFFSISVWIWLDSDGKIFYAQVRIGKRKQPFYVLKFRTMREGSDQKGLLTVGDRDFRITRAGYWLRKYKVDELPQLFNILLGKMSFVGPRPEVSKYVALYDRQQQRVFSVKPGLTDWASIQLMNESELLANAADPENFYRTTLIPMKIQLALKYIDHQSLWTDLNIIIDTLKCILRSLPQ
ncbi:sugar transferase [Pedobacter gandavensis]|uniref:sugar transferase n=1 Tax=Pedobacter gandavensis TaxID=2679963 RepID=UPI00292D89CA|nr:sugar transferase [Pedobacter gandavensis]